MGVAYSAPLCPSVVFSCYSFVIRRSCQRAEMAQATVHMQCNTNQAQHSTNEGVLLSISAWAMLVSVDLRLPRRGLEPGPSGFWEVDSTARTLPLSMKWLCIPDVEAINTILRLGSFTWRKKKTYCRGRRRRREAELHRYLSWDEWSNIGGRDRINR